MKKILFLLFIISGFCIEARAYQLTVANGYGSDNYIAGTTVTIVAMDPAPGQIFDQWVATHSAPGVVVLDNAFSTTTIVRMPPFDVTVTATYKDVPDTLSPTISITFPLAGAVVRQHIVVTQMSSDLLGVTRVEFLIDNQIVLSTNNPTAGYYWTTYDYSDGTHTLLAKAYDAAGNMGISFPVVVTVENFISNPTYHLDVIHGSGSGDFQAGTSVTIAADTAPVNKAFDQWVGANVDDAAAERTNLTMPSSPTVVTATYKDITYPITIVNGSGSGAYKLGSAITIVANNPATGYEFEQWQTWPADLTIYDKSASSTTIVLTSTNVYVMALFKLIPETISTSHLSAEHWDIYQPQNVPWTDAQAMTTFGGFLYVSGSKEGSPQNTLWRSTDGSTWTTVDFPFPPQVPFHWFIINRFAVMNGTLYGAALESSDLQNSDGAPTRHLYQTQNGLTWNEVTIPTSVGPGTWYDMAAYNNRLYLSDEDGLVLTYQSSNPGCVADSNFSVQPLTGKTPISFAVGEQYLLAGVVSDNSYNTSATISQTGNGTSWNSLNTLMGEKLRPGYVEFSSHLYWGGNYLEVLNPTPPASAGHMSAGNLPVPFVVNNQLHVYSPSSQVLGLNSQNNWDSLYTGNPSFCATNEPRYSQAAQLNGDTFILPCALMRIKPGAYVMTLTNYLSNPVNADQKDVALLTWNNQINFEDTLTKLTVKNLGTALAGHDVDGLSLYLVTGTTSSKKLADLNALSEGKTWVTPASFQAKVHDGDQYFIAADISTSPTHLSTLQFSIPIDGFSWATNSAFKPASSLTAPQAENISNPISQAPPLSDLDKVMPYPVPARDIVYFTYTLSSTSDIEMDIYDRSGARMTHLQESGKPADKRAVTSWDATSAPSGIYYARTTIHGADGSKKIYKSKFIIEK